MESLWTTDAAVLVGVKTRVATGEYLDERRRKPGHALEGGGAFVSDSSGRLLQRLYQRGTPEYEEAKAAGMLEPLPPLRPATEATVAEAEEELGHPLPALLRRLYLEVGNGGFGPAYGILGLERGHPRGRGETAIEVYRSWTHEYGLLPLCEWGCGIYSLLDFRTDDGQVWGFDPNPVPEELLAPHPEGVGLATWLDRWLRGEDRQPWMVEDEETGEWRGATDAEYEQLRLESEEWESEAE
jgi:hypothetical protein